MVRTLTFVVLAFASIAASFPSNLNGLSLSGRRTPVNLTAEAIDVVGPPPGPLAYTGTQLSNDAAHPFMPL